MPTPLGSLTLKLLLYRFFSLILSVTLTCSLWQSRSLSLQVSMLPSTIANEEADYKRREDLFTVMWVASIGCHMVEFFGVLFGMSLKSIQVHVFSIFCRLLGSFLLLLGLMDSWDYRYYIWIFGLFSYAPALTEIWCIFRFVVFDFNLMKQIEIRV
ncbi:hypothetical protein TL16_g05953 [Triparma laevis f. inornata]|uniref:Transmembrane protein 107 n=2 Tax=Triparma laevis TaxID=1534972 RepID=A0A9W7KRL0_9STRA|nr:hypothetical protein TL16_g05953 [Triparma laevis f. inornata]GMI09182.1 hypothetical protein TrLO_g12380 [Triparma laevis f. longispina]